MINKLKLSDVNEKQLSRGAVLLSAIIILGVIVFVNPFWGLMDDHFNALEMVPAMERQGILTYAWEYGLQDLAWGMFRPTNPLMVYFLYWPAVHTAPWVLFFLNALVSFGILFLCARIFSKIVELDFWPVLLMYGCFFYLHDLLQHPSLQEKMIHLFGIVLLYLCHRRERGFATWGGILVFSALGILVKASFVIYLSMAVWIVFWRDEKATLKKRLTVTLIPILILISATIFFAYISTLGAYTTGGYSSRKILPNLMSVHGGMFLLPLVCVALYSLITGLAWRRPLQLTPAVGVAAFLAIFLPWGIAGYIQAAAGPYFCVVLVFLAEKLVPRKLHVAWTILLCALCVGVSTYRSATMFGRLSDIGRIVSSAGHLRSLGVQEILMTCSEGRGAMERFFEKIAGVTMKFSQLNVPFSATDVNDKYILFDQAMCVLPRRAAGIEGCDGKEVFSGSFSKSYRIVKFTCQ